MDKPVIQCSNNVLKIPVNLVWVTADRESAGDCRSTAVYFVRRVT